MRIFVLMFCLLSLAACAAAATQATVGTTAIPGFVTDLPSFDRFIASQPTPEQFRSRYPDVTLVLPGSISTKELRLNHSRYFAQLDAQGRISGGQFR